MQRAIAGVDPAPEDTADSRVRWVRAPAAALIPELWSRGLELAQGNVVAITTSHFEPAPGWVEAVRAASARLDARRYRRADRSAARLDCQGLGYLLSSATRTDGATSLATTPRTGRRR